MSTSSIPVLLLYIVLFIKLLTISSTTDDSLRATAATNERLLRGTCERLSQQISQGNITCQCDWMVRKRSVSFECSYYKSICLVPEVLCGAPSYTGTYNMPSSTLTSDVCIDFENVTFPPLPPNITLPPNVTLPPLPSIPSQACISAQHCIGNMTYLCDCKAQIGNTTCNSCTVCDNGRSISADCTNYDPMAEFTCVGI